MNDAATPIKSGIASLITFLVGADLVLVILSLCTRWQEGGWLPLALTLVVFELLHFVPRLCTAITRSLIGIALLGGTAALWFMSQAVGPLDSERFGSFIPPMAFAMVAGALVLLALYPQERRIVPKLSWQLVALLIVMMWLVAYFSSSHGGGGGMLHFMVTALGVPERFAETILVPLRKTIHFTFYGSVGLVAWSLAKSALDGGGPAWRRLCFGLLIALSLASFDEARQSSQPGRTGAVTDVMLDMTGALAFVGGAEFRTRRQEKKVT